MTSPLAVRLDVQIPVQAAQYLEYSKNLKGRSYTSTTIKALALMHVVETYVDQECRIEIVERSGARSVLDVDL